VKVLELTKKERVRGHTRTAIQDRLHWVETGVRKRVVKNNDQEDQNRRTGEDERKTWSLTATPSTSRVFLIRSNTKGKESTRNYIPPGDYCKKICSPSSVLGKRIERSPWYRKEKGRIRETSASFPVGLKKRVD